jgi:hypothetical protein
VNIVPARRIIVSFQADGIAVAIIGIELHIHSTPPGAGIPADCVSAIAFWMVTRGILWQSDPDWLFNCI